MCWKQCFDVMSKNASGPCCPNVLWSWHANSNSRETSSPFTFTFYCRCDCCIKSAVECDWMQISFQDQLKPKWKRYIQYCSTFEDPKLEEKRKSSNWNWYKLKSTKCKPWPGTSLSHVAEKVDIVHHHLPWTVLYTDTTVLMSCSHAARIRFQQHC